MPNLSQSNLAVRMVIVHASNTYCNSKSNQLQAKPHAYKYSVDVRFSYVLINYHLVYSSGSTGIAPLHVHTNAEVATALR